MPRGDRRLSGVTYGNACRPTSACCPINVCRASLTNGSHTWQPGLQGRRSAAQIMCTQSKGRGTVLWRRGVLPIRGAKLFG
jgi:hypothetical protein